MNRFVFFLTTLLAIWPLSAADNFTTSGRALLLSAGARPISMGGAYTALGDDLSSVQYNPAGIGKLFNFAIDTHYSSLYEDISYKGLTLGVPGPLGSALGLSYFNLDSGSIDKNIASSRGSYLETEGSFKAQSDVFIVTIANSRYDPLQAGFNFKVFKEAIDGISASGMFFDFGLLFTLSPEVRLGARANNIGSKIKFIDEDEKVPQSYAGGLAIRPLKGGNLALSADLVKTNGQKNQFSSGAEYIFTKNKKILIEHKSPFRSRKKKAVTVEYQRAPLLALRAGVRPDAADNLGNAALATFGMGFYFGESHLDYSFVGAGELGATHRISFGVSFGRNPWLLVNKWEKKEWSRDPDDNKKEKMKQYRRKSSTGRYTIE